MEYISSVSIFGAVVKTKPTYIPAAIIIPRNTRPIDFNTIDDFFSENFFVLPLSLFPEADLEELFFWLRDAVLSCLTFAERELLPPLRVD
jgi:hypothetical protein